MTSSYFQERRVYLSEEEIPGAWHGDTRKKRHSQETSGRKRVLNKQLIIG